MQLNEGLNWETFTWWISGALDVVQMTGKCAGISLPVFTWGGFDREEESVVVNRRIPTNDNTVGGGGLVRAQRQGTAVVTSLL